jgi:hypothetical protein
MHIVPKPDYYDPDHAAAVRAEFAVIYGCQHVADARAALEALPGEFEREREHEQHEIDALRRRMATCSASEKPILEKRLKKHTTALGQMNPTLRLRWAREAVAIAESRLQVAVDRVVTTDAMAA